MEISIILFTIGLSLIVHGGAILFMNRNHKIKINDMRIENDSLYDINESQKHAIKSMNDNAASDASKIKQLKNYNNELARKLREKQNLNEPSKIMDVREFKKITMDSIRRFKLDNMCNIESIGIVKYQGIEVTGITLEIGE